MRKLKKFIALGFAFYIISCGKTDTSVNLYEPTIADATSTTTLAQLKEGKSIYSGTCNACHQLYSPDAYAATDWKRIIPNMASRTNLTSAQIVLVTKYVTRGK